MNWSSPKNRRKTGVSALKVGISHVLITALLLALAISSPAWGQTPDSEPHAGQAGLLNFDGKILDRLGNIFDRQGNQWGERFDRVDRVEDAQGRIGSRIGKFLDRFDGSFLDRVGNLVWLTFIVLMVAGVCFGLRQIAGVLESFAAVGKAWRGGK